MDIAEEVKQVDDLINKLKNGEDIYCKTDTLQNITGQRIRGNGSEVQEDLLSTLFTLHDQGKLTHELLWDLARKHDQIKSNKSMKPIELIVQLVVDGDQWCALIGENLQVGIAGFGDTRIGALLNLINNYQKEHSGWVCKDCGKETRTFWPDKHRGDIGRCNECHFKYLAIKFPAPLLTEMKTTTAQSNEEYYTYKVWPHNYIPAVCPYCQQDICRAFVGSYNDHVLHENYCNACKVYFGQTD